MSDKLDQTKAMMILNLLINGNGGKEETVTFTNQDGKPVTFEVSGNGIKTQADLKGYRDAIEEVVSHLPVSNAIGNKVTELLDARGNEKFKESLQTTKNALTAVTLGNAGKEKEHQPAPVDLDKAAKSMTPLKAGMILEKAVGKFEGKNWSFDPKGFGDNPVMYVDVGKLKSAEWEAAADKLAADMKAAGLPDSMIPKIGYNEKTGRLQIRLDMSDDERKALAGIEQKQGIAIGGGEGIGAGVRGIEVVETPKPERQAGKDEKGIPQPMPDKGPEKPVDLVPPSPPEPEPGLLNGGEPVKLKPDVVISGEPVRVNDAAPTPIEIEIAKKEKRAGSVDGAETKTEPAKPDDAAKVRPREAAEILGKEAGEQGPILTYQSGEQGQVLTIELNKLPKEKQDSVRAQVRANVKAAGLGSRYSEGLENGKESITITLTDLSEKEQAGLKALQGKQEAGKGEELEQKPASSIPPEPEQGPAKPANAGEAQPQPEPEKAGPKPVAADGQAKLAAPIDAPKAGEIVGNALGKFEGKDWSYDSDGFGKGKPTISVEVGKLTNNEFEKACEKLAADMKAAGLPDSVARGMRYNEKTGRLLVRLDHLSDKDLEALAKLQQPQQTEKAGPKPVPVTELEGKLEKVPPTPPETTVPPKAEKLDDYNKRMEEKGKLERVPPTPPELTTPPKAEKLDDYNARMEAEGKLERVPPKPPEPTIGKFTDEELEQDGGTLRAALKDAGGPDFRSGGGVGHDEKKAEASPREPTGQSVATAASGIQDAVTGVASSLSAVANDMVKGLPPEVQAMVKAIGKNLAAMGGGNAQEADNRLKSAPSVGGNGQSQGPQK